MPSFMIAFIVAAVVLRFLTLFVSIRNEKRMKANGAVEYCAGTSTLLALTHIAFYLAAIGESVWQGAPVTGLTYFGMVLYALAMLALVWVISVLGRFWTVKVIVAQDHQLVTNRVFNAIRHPNYFLNIIPELIGFALALQALGTLIVGLPVYLVVLILRIRQEEAAMREHFPAYGVVD
ncbi:isoprenylcysteine carboxyl methyltransferase family protein [Roseibium sp.]|uniref:isoprenylcysteine carboxyl methyltransferase family protein n=1 Tax=Roseibium sp. TaxID=1936156 RepID=UPI003A98049B